MKQSNRKPTNDSDQATEDVEVCRIAEAEPVCRKSLDKVVIERAVTIMVEEVGSFTILCTPTDIKALAVGFVFSEGMIRGIDDVISISSAPADDDVIGITVEDASGMGTNRSMVVASSCGMCGARNLKEQLSALQACGNSLEMPRKALAAVVGQMESMQVVFGQTGGTHAAGVFSAEGKIVAFAEDIGRHNALDKAIGKCLLARQPTVGCGVALSGRVSFEMVAKAASAGIELILAVSAPSSFAIDAADRWNVTLCGFARAGRFNIYTHSERICDL